MVVARTVDEAAQTLRYVRSAAALPSRGRELDANLAFLVLQDLELCLGELVERGDDVDKL